MSINEDQIAKTCFDFYKKNIPPNIRPGKNEWTTLAALVMSYQGKNKFQK